MLRQSPVPQDHSRMVGVQSSRCIPIACHQMRGEDTVKTRIIVVVLALFCSLALSISLQSQDAGIAEKVKQLQQDQINAEMKNDVSWAQQHLADGFVAGHSWGKWETKADLIKNWQSNPTKWTSGNISDVHVATF